MGENDAKEEEVGACMVNKPQASCPTADEWGRGGSPAGEDAPNSRVGGTSGCTNLLPQVS